MVNCLITYLLFVCAIRLESKMQGGVDLIREAMFFSRQTSLPGWFYLTKGATF